MFGPESTATGRPRTSVESRSPVSGSRPLVRPSTGASPGSASTTERNARLGTATTTRSASAIGASVDGGRVDPAQVDLASGSAGCARSRGSPARRRRGGSRASPRGRGRRAAARSPCPTSRRRRRRPSRPPPEVDRHRHALELEALAQLVLDPVGVVAGDEARVVDGEAEARRPRGDLRAVEQVQALAAARRRLARLVQLAEEAVQLGRRDRGPRACRRARPPCRGRA